MFNPSKIKKINWKIAYNEQAFIFDMCVMNYKELKLKEVKIKKNKKNL